MTDGFNVGNKVWLKLDNSPTMLINEIEDEDDWADLIWIDRNGDVQRMSCVDLQLLTRTNPDDVTP